MIDLIARFLAWLVSLFTGRTPEPEIHTDPPAQPVPVTPPRYDGNHAAWRPDDAWYRVIDEAARERNINPEVLVALAKAESGLRNIPTGIKFPPGHAKAGQVASSAFGPWQFILGTWRGIVRNYPQYGLTEADRTNPYKQAVGAALLADESLRIIGRAAPTATDLYCAWFLGAAAAKPLVNAPPGARATDYTTPAILRTHGISTTATVGEFITFFANALRGRGKIDPYTPARLK